jgi:hypothetical protein
MRAMHDTIKDGVGHRGIAHVLMPPIARQLTGDDRRPGAIAVIEDLEQVLTVSVF